jgi:hypothetical protein
MTHADERTYRFTYRDRTPAHQALIMAGGRRILCLAEQRSACGDEHRK